MARVEADAKVGMAATLEATAAAKAAGWCDVGRSRSNRRRARTAQTQRPAHRQSTRRQSPLSDCPRIRSCI
jgi:hypothetical protein